MPAIIVTNTPPMTRPSSPIPIVIDTIKAFRLALENAKPGQTLLYYEGDLMYDRAYNTKLTKSDKSKLNALAGAVYEAYEVGRVLLTQNRVGPHVWTYQAVIRANKYRHGPHEHETAALRAMLEHIEQQRKWRENADARKQNKRADKAPSS